MVEDENWMKIGLTKNPGMITITRGVYEYQLLLEEDGTLTIYTWRKIVLDSTHSGQITIYPTNVYYDGSTPERTLPGHDDLGREEDGETE